MHCFSISYFVSLPGKNRLKTTISRLRRHFLFCPAKDLYILQSHCFHVYQSFWPKLNKYSEYQQIEPHTHSMLTNVVFHSLFPHSHIFSVKGDQTHRERSLKSATQGQLLHLTLTIQFNSLKVISATSESLAKSEGKMMTWIKPSQLSKFRLEFIQKGNRVERINCT